MPPARGTRTQQAIQTYANKFMTSTQKEMFQRYSDNHGQKRLGRKYQWPPSPHPIDSLGALKLTDPTNANKRLGVECNADGEKTESPHHCKQPIRLAGKKDPEGKEKVTLSRLPWRQKKNCVDERRLSCLLDAFNALIIEPVAIRRQNRVIESSL